MKIRNDLKKWQEYIPVKSAESISFQQNINIERIDKLDANENVYGPSPLVVKRLSQFKGYQFYPDPEYYSLRKELAGYIKVDEKNIFVSNGADEIIDILLRLILESGDEVVDCPPTFSSYSLSTLLNRGKVIVVPRKGDFSIDLDTIIASITKKTKIVFICNPNNPTGNITSLNEIEQILKKGILVCVDEAYIEFGGESAVPLLAKYKNLIIIRSLSKWAGIAGLRLGYGLVDEYLSRQLMKIKPPYNVNSAAVIAGIASLQDKKYRDDVISEVRSERNKFEKAGFLTGGNFVFIKTSTAVQKFIQEECVTKGIYVRAYMSGVIKGALRITIGKPLQNSKILTILKRYI